MGYGLANLSTFLHTASRRISFTTAHSLLRHLVDLHTRSWAKTGSPTHPDFRVNSNHYINILSQLGNSFATFRTISSLLNWMGSSSCINIHSSTIFTVRAYRLLLRQPPSLQHYYGSFGVFSFTSPFHSFGTHHILFRVFGKGSSSSCASIATQVLSIFIKPPPCGYLDRVAPCLDSYLGGGGAWEDWE